MKYRKLRIAWSVFWGLACGLLIVLWARSYQSIDFVQIGLAKSRAVCSMSVFGRLWIYSNGPMPNAIYPPFEMDSHSIGERYYEADSWDFSGEVLGFRWSGGSNWHLTIPDWAFVLLCVATAVLPWLR